MSASSQRGNLTYRRSGAEAVSTARSTTSVDTGVLLQRADDAGMLDTARSAASVDTDLLLGDDLVSARDLDQPPLLSGTDEVMLNSTHTKTADLSSFDDCRPLRSPTNSSSLVLQSDILVGTEDPFNGTYNQSTSLPLSSSVANQVPMSSSPPPLPRSGDLLSSPVLGSKGRFHADELGRRELDQSLITARSVASADCAPVEYDEDMLRDSVDQRRSSGFECCVLNKRKMFEDRPLAGSSGSTSCFLNKACSAERSYPDKVLDSGASGVDVCLLNKRQTSDHCHTAGSKTFEGSCPDKVLGRGSSGFESPVLDQRRLSELDDGLCSVTARSDASLDAAMRLRDITFSPAAGSDDMVLDSGTTSRTLASVDTDVLLQRTEDVVVAMEAARTNHVHRISSRDPSPSAGYDAAAFHDDLDHRNAHMVDRPEADYETETVDVMGKIRSVPPHSSLIKPPLADKTLSANSAAMDYGRHGTREAWGTSSDYDIRGNSGRPRQVPAPGRARTAQVSQKRSTSAEFDEYAARSFDRRRQAVPVRTSYGTRTYPTAQDSDRSMASSASLGAHIVARSRQNLRPASGKARRTADTAAAAKKKIPEQQRDRDLSPSGLVLEGFSVPLRPSTSGSHDRTEDRPTKWSVNRPATAVESRLNQKGRSEARSSAGVGVGVGGTGSRRKDWVDDASSLNDSLSADSRLTSAALDQPV